MELAAARKQLEIAGHEYDRAHGLTPATVEPSRHGQVRRRGGELGGRMEKDGEPDPAPAPTRPTYSTPIKNLRAARAAAEELPSLEGEERARQHARVQELLCVADEQAGANRQTQEELSYSRGGRLPANSRGASRDT